MSLILKEINILLDDIEECGICEYKNLCGGACRGRAYLFTGDMKKRILICLAAKRFYDKSFCTIYKYIVFIII